jgi:hypothetical protein
VTRHPDAFLAALSVSDEAAAIVGSAAHKRRRAATAIGVAGVVALAGTNAAAAANGTLWWSAPHEIVAEAVPLGDGSAPATSVSVILAADYAGGVDGSSAAARDAFRLAQSWLAEHPIVVEVPSDARTLTEQEEEVADASGIPLQIALEQKAILATEDEVAAAVADAYDDLLAGVGTRLADNGVDASLIVIDPDNGHVEVVR